jgi:hypothetical protein
MVAKSLLAAIGHLVVLEVANVPEALAAIYGGRVEDERVTLAVVATDIDQSSTQEFDGADGRNITDGYRSGFSWF